MSNNIDPATEGKNIVNSLYHSSVVIGLALGYAKISKMVFGGSLPKFDFAVKDVLMITAHVTLADMTRDMLVQQGIIPDNILKM